LDLKAFTWENRQVLVTGAGGFIGSHLAERLIHEGARVRAFVRYTSRNDPGLLRYLTPDDFTRLEIVAGDLRDPQAVLQAVKGCEIVFHLGALISIPYSYRHPVEVAETNVMGAVNLLSACKEAGVGRLVHASSSEVYGTALRVPIDESHPLQGQSPYSASKIGADKLVESFFCAFNLPVVTVRPFNTYGPRQSARAVIPTIITQALKLDCIRLGSLDTRRDFTYVSDTVNGFILAAAAEGVEGKTFNLGSGHEISIGDLAERIIQLVGRKVEIEQENRRLRPEGSEVLRLLSDNRLAQAQLGWQPTFDLQDGLCQTIAWIQQNLDHFQVGEYLF
jgi:dTDP-glucose 4,6-dehydratase